MTTSGHVWMSETSLPVNAFRQENAESTVIPLFKFAFLEI